MKSSVVSEEAGVWTCTMWMCMYLSSEEVCGVYLVKRCANVYLVTRLWMCTS